MHTAARASGRWVRVKWCWRETPPTHPPARSGSRNVTDRGRDLGMLLGDGWLPATTTLLMRRMWMNCCAVPCLFPCLQFPTRASYLCVGSGCLSSRAAFWHLIRFPSVYGAPYPCAWSVRVCPFISCARLGAKMGQHTGDAPHRDEVGCNAIMEMHYEISLNLKKKQDGYGLKSSQQTRSTQRSPITFWNITQNGRPCQKKAGYAQLHTSPGWNYKQLSSVVCRPGTNLPSVGEKRFNIIRHWSTFNYPY